MTKLNIAVYFTGDFPEGGATVSRLKGYFSELKKNHSIYINILWQDSFSNTGMNDHVWGEWEGIPYIYHNNTHVRPASTLGKLFNTIRSVFNSSVHLVKSRKQIDIIYIYNPEFHYFFHILILARILKIPVVIEQTELQSSIYMQPGSKKNIFYRLKKWSENHMHLYADAAVVISDQLYKHYKPAFKQNLFVVPALVDIKRFAPDDKNQKKYLVGYIGSFGVKDGIPGMLEAFSMALKDFPQLKLRMIGNYDEHPNVIKLITKFQLENIVELTGRALYHRVPALLNECDLLICNRINSAYANYGFPTKLVEYMALETPVISSSTGDIREYISDEFINFIEPENIMELYMQIVSRYKNYDIYNEKAIKGKSVILQKFDSRICALLLEDVLMKKAGGRK